MRATVMENTVAPFGFVMIRQMEHQKKRQKEKKNS